MTESKEKPKEESTERTSDSMRKLLETAIPKTPTIPAHILDFAASGFSTSLLESVRQVTYDRTSQMKALMSAMPQWDFASLVPKVPPMAILAPQISKAFEMPDHALLKNFNPVFNLEAMRIDVDGWLPNLFKNLNIPNSVADLIPTWFTPELLERLHQSLRIGRPHNWEDTIDDEAAESLAAAGWPIVWVPRSSIVAELIKAEDDTARHQLLVTRAAQIFETALELVEAEELHFLRRLATEAVSAARQDLLAAAQATAAVVADTSCHDFLGLTRNGEILSKANPDIDSVPIRGLLKMLCLAIIAATFATFRPENGDPVPDEYNRHATIHRASEPQYSTANAVKAIMTAVIAVCQIDHELGRRDPHEDDEEAAA
jgi:hypothetical protein